MRSGLAVIFLLSVSLAAETSQITALRPDVVLYPGDRVSLELQAVFTGQQPNNRNVARFEIKEVSAKGTRTVVGLTTSASNGAATVTGSYVVPQQYCFECLGHVNRISSLEITVDLFTTTGGARIATSPPRRLTVNYPTVKSVTPASMPIQTEAAGSVQFEGFAPLDSGKRLVVRYLKNSTGLLGTGATYDFPAPRANPCPSGELSSGFGLYFGPCNTAFSDSAIAYQFLAYFFYTPTEVATRLGLYDVVVEGPPPDRNLPFTVLSPGLADAVLPASFSLTAAKTDDVINIKTLSIGNTTKTVDLNLTGANVVSLTPGELANFTVSPSFKLSSLGYGVLWGIVRDRTTGVILRAQDKYVVNTRGQFATEVYAFNRGFFPTFFTTPDTGHVLEFYLSLTPVPAKFDDPYDESRAFAVSPKIAVTLGDAAESVPGNFPPPRQVTDTRFVTASGPGLGTPCLKRSRGPIEIDINVPRAMGEVETDGRLVWAPAMIANSVISEKALLRIMSFGRRLQGSAPRKDRVFFNGKEITELTSGHEQWSTGYAVQIPIADLLFPAHVQGQLPTPRRNRLRIDIDADSPAGAENWCASVAWTELSFSALAPLVFVHGNGQGDDNNGGAFWDGGVLDTADQPRLQMRFAFITPIYNLHVPFDKSISMMTASIADHGDLLKTLIPRAAAEWGANHAHIITHSKGALDSRDFLARTIPPNFGVYSIHTVAGPHRGSSGPDYQIDGQGASLTFSDDSVRTAIGAAAPPNAGTLSLRVASAAEFNRRNVPFLPVEQKVDGVTHTVQYRSISADMNTDNSVHPITGNPTISLDEAEGLPGQADHFDTTWASVLQTCYRITGYVVSTTVEFVDRTHRGKVVRYKAVREKLTPTFRLNDIAVTTESSRVGPFQEILHLKANHSTIASPDVAQAVIDSIRKIQPVPNPVP